MRTVKINYLNIRNFKGFREFRLNLSGENAWIYGDNATGKTTIYDAFTWLLFGKDSLGNTKFGIKPIGRIGVAPEVTAELDVDGRTVVLRKSLREKWEKHRGGEERFAGNTVDYFIDDVPYKENKYKSMIDSIVHEDQFRMLTSVYRFCRDCGYKERREILFELANIPPDDELLSEFPALMDAADGRPIADFRAMLVHKRKDLNSTLNQLPTRIDECDRQIASLELLDFEAASRRADDLRKAKREQTDRLSEITAGNGKVMLAAEIKEIESEIRALEAENESHRASQRIPSADKRPELNGRINLCRSEIRRIEQYIEDARVDTDRCANELENLRRAWKAENDQNFSAEVCAYCGQPLPGAKVVEAKRKFEQQRQSKLDEITQRAAAVDEQMNSAGERIKQREEELLEHRSELERLESELSAYVPPVVPEPEDLPWYDEKHRTLETKLNEKRAQVKQIEQELAGVTTRLRADIDELTRKLSVELETLAAQSTLKSLQQRVAELNEQQRTVSAEVERMDVLIEQCEAFARFKAERITDAVNQQFRFARFRLFTEAINGSVQDCCDVTVHNVPYSDLNNAMKINVGTDVINALSRYYGVRVPLIIDNAESITAPIPIETQRIYLNVSREDKELRVE